MPSVRRVLLPLAVLLIGAYTINVSSATAKSADRTIPATADGKKFSGDLSPNSKSQLDGSVVITQGTLKITGEHADLYSNDAGALSRAVVTGERAHVEQLDDANLLVTADARSIDYNVDSGLAVLTGSAHALKQTGGSVAGDIIHYNVNAGTFNVVSTGTTVTHITFEPKRQGP
jgi:lipopolysaccharide export system protein LptA